jgi:hypothetical protein
LLPNYDEYFIGLKDRSAIGQVVRKAGIRSDDPSFLANVVVLNGQVVGGWKRTVKKNAVLLEFTLVVNLTKAQERAVAEAASRYAEFLQLPLERI